MIKYLITAVMLVSAIAGLRCGNADARSAAETGAVVTSPPAGKAMDPSTTNTWQGETGTASYYGCKEDGRRSASGARFNMRLLTAAHAWLPFGTKVRVTLDNTGRSVIVTITDRLYSKRRIVDLSVAAARQLGMIQRGVAEVTLAPA